MPQRKRDLQIPKQPFLRPLLVRPISFELAYSSTQNCLEEEEVSADLKADIFAIFVNYLPFTYPGSRLLSSLL
ncbi:hypothetical protein K1719_001819 [Acacia pycnantha]|nr:hypothetical protein K1719_001819 [Acacia pycnantha]